MGCGSRVGGSHSLIGSINSELCSGSKYRCPGGSSCYSVARWLIGALLPVMRSHKFSTACNSSWGASLWHCIVFAKCSVTLMILPTGVTVGVFYGTVIIFPRVGCAHRYCLIGGLDNTIVFQWMRKVPSLDCVVAPRVPTHRLEVDRRFSSNWFHRVGIKIIHSLRCF